MSGLARGAGSKSIGGRDRLRYERNRKGEDGAEGVLKTISLIACLDGGFRDRFFFVSHAMSHINLSIRLALAIPGLHGFGVAIGLRTSSQWPVWCRRLPY